jgi:hypothetical protein
MSARGGVVFPQTDAIASAASRGLGTGGVMSDDEQPARSLAPRILAVAGTGQNGSTLLSRLLGEVPGVVAVGEIGRLWDKALVERDPCSCGKVIHDCVFWAEVGARAFGGWDQVDGSDVARLRDSLQFGDRRLQHPFALPFLLAPSVWPRFASQLRTYQELMDRLYRAIAEVADGALIVDAMKVPAHVYMLSGLRGLDPAYDVRFVHLVRDSRGVAYSKSKVVKRQGAGDDFRARRSPVKSATQWTWFNLSSSALVATRHVPMIRVRYEDVVRDPAAQMRALFRHAGIDAEHDLSFIRGRTVTLTSGHIVAGNRMRSISGEIALREDQWRTQLERRARITVTTVTWPLLRRYGYTGRRARTPAGSEPS